MKFRPSPAMIAAMQKGMNTPKVTPPAPAIPLPLPEKPVTEHPLSDRWIIQGFKLSPYKTSYFAVLKNSFFCVVRRCGESNLSLTRHIIDLYTLPADAKRVDQVTKEKPLQSAFSPAFYFLDEHAAYQATLKTIQTEFTA